MPCIPFLQALGHDGMSGDESDHGFGEKGGHRNYAIIDEDWRAPAIRPWLRTIDLLKIAMKFRADGTPAPGNWPRTRKPLGRSIHGRAAAGLPRDFYSSNWLAAQTPEQLNDL